jgi:prolycopene isomerase
MSSCSAQEVWHTVKILGDSVLRDRYDVIVVGAGVGGMAAGALLAKQGISVLMIDQQDKPGGSCTSFKRNDVVYDVGTAMIYGFGETGFKPFRFIMNELEEPIDIVAQPTLARMTIEGQKVVFWPDLERFENELGDMFPEEREGIRSFYRELYGMYENIVLRNEVIVPPSEFSPQQGLRSLLSNPIAMLKMQKLLTVSVKSLLDKHFHTKPIIDFFDKLCSAYDYCTAAETPAVLAATMFIDNHVGGVYYPAGGAQNLPNTIEKAFERDGGQMLYRQKVDEVLIKGDTAYGVRLTDGTEILAERVIADATVWNIYGKLVKPEHMSPERLAWAKSLVSTYPSMTMYMLVDAQALPADTFPWEIFIENRALIDSSDLTLYTNSLVDHTLAPEGQMVVMAIAPNMLPWPSPDSPDYRSESYEAQKRQEAERMLGQIEAHFPGFRTHICTLIVATPTTIERYLLKNGGAVGGPKNMLGQQMLKRLHARSEWKNLYFCGDSTVMGTGAPATAVSGVGAANMVLRDLHRREYDRRRFKKQYIHFVTLPYDHPRYQSGQCIGADTASLAAAQCQWCEKPDCVAVCPAHVDIPGFLRRMEVGNVVGAARVIRQTNPLGEVCGTACGLDAPCRRDCYRISFAGKPVEITELQRWICETAGAKGWPQGDVTPCGRRAAILGGGPAALTAAYYLALSGWQVDLFTAEDSPGARLAEVSLPEGALQRDLQGMMLSGIHFCGGTHVHSVQDLETLTLGHDAVYVAGTPWSVLTSAVVTAHPGWILTPEFKEGNATVVEAVAQGRCAAAEIQKTLVGRPE